MPSTRSQSQSSIQFPKTKTAKTQAKEVLRSRAKSDIGAVPLPPVSKELPLSPRKRLGGDNLCNIPQSLRCSPPKQRCNENGPLSPAKGRRLIFDENQAAVTPLSPAKNGQDTAFASPQKRGQETPSSNSRRGPQERKSVCTRLFKQEGTCYQKAKCALNTAVPERLLAREKETTAILSFLKTHVTSQKPGSLYISGAPGTGKTACLTKLLQENKVLPLLEGPQTLLIVLLKKMLFVSSSLAVFPAIAEEISGSPKLSASGKDMVRNLEKMVTSKGPVILLVLDEMDQLDSKGQDVLYTVFEWPWLPNSRVVLIGIANALDLTDRILPRLQARPHCRPQLLNFSPYTKDQIATILQDRLTQVSGDQVLDNAAIQFCARKVSAVSGDARKALEICRRAVEIVESDVRSQTVLKPLSGCPSPSKEAASTPVPKKVSLPHISRVISDVYGDKMAAGGGGEDSFPLQQKLLVCSLLLLTQQSKIKEVTLGKLHDTYSKVCRKQQMPAVGQSECLSLCQLLETRGIVGLKKSKEARLAKVSLKIEERDIEHAFKDKVLIGNVLHAGI
ncbi:PREDICTED: LOW QUALITY PROTEIN: cell division control protein 6 homolog [Nanorana parkeri]|uniref:LOW QUALITY PROTEIN: cell division control protein 6 homolog n=1 Tax=Nanorana parkeri TaxID=125878 RepID=UPI0008550134|nr:PREDICTED: LOW QUALITY PROTEIN: cell division control protein 6 homolog [Nanorana parkeri]